VADELTDDKGDFDGLLLRVALFDANFDALEDDDSVILTLMLGVLEADFVGLLLNVLLTDNERDTVTDVEAVKVFVALAVKLLEIDADALAEHDALGDSEELGLRETEPVTDADFERLPLDVSETDELLLPLIE
jgi:hypothetical protein